MADKPEFTSEQVARFEVRLQMERACAAMAEFARIWQEGVAEELARLARIRAERIAEAKRQDEAYQTWRALQPEPEKAEATS